MTLRQKQIALVERRQAAVVANARQSMFLVLEDAVDQIVTSYNQTGRYVAPDLSGLDDKMLLFYRKLIRTAIVTSEQIKKMQDKKARLNTKPWGIPTQIRKVKDVFEDTTYWRRIVARSYAYSNKLKKAYLQKLKTRFDQISPMIESGKLEPRIVKQEMRKAFEATKSRVETTFRTETTNYYGRTQIAYFKDDEDVIGFMFDSVRDTSRTEICRSRHGLIYRPDTKLLSENTPALHYNCRSQLIPLANTAENRRMLADPSRNPNTKKVVPLPRGWRK